MQFAREVHRARDLRMRLCRRIDFFVSVGTRILYRYLEEHPDRRIYGFNTADLALTPEVREMMHRPEGAHVDLNALEKKLDVIVDGWQSRVRDRLYELIGGQMKSGAAEEVDPLELATTMFRCDKCNETCLRFPAVLSHKCQRPDYMEWQQDAWEDIVRRRNGLRGRLGNPDIGFALSLALSRCKYLEPAYQIVRLCGMEPAVATSEQMDALDVRLVQGDVIMTWSAAVSTALRTI